MPMQNEILIPIPTCVYGAISQNRVPRIGFEQRRCIVTTWIWKKQVCSIAHHSPQHTSPDGAICSPTRRFAVMPTSIPAASPQGCTLALRVRLKKYPRVCRDVWGLSYQLNPQSFLPFLPIKANNLKAS